MLYAGGVSRATLVGVSDGERQALAVAHRHPERVGKVMAAAVGLVTLVIRSGRRRTALVAAVGLVALPFAATTMFVWLNGSGLPEPWLAYGRSMLPYGRWSDQWRLEDTLVYYPVLYTWCAWFLAACCLHTVTRRRV